MKKNPIINIEDNSDQFEITFTKKATQLMSKKKKKTPSPSKSNKALDNSPKRNFNVPLHVENFE